MTPCTKISAGIIYFFIVVYIRHGTYNSAFFDNLADVSHSYTRPNLVTTATENQPLLPYNYSLVCNDNCLLEAGLDFRNYKNKIEATDMWRYMYLEQSSNPTLYVDRDVLLNWKSGHLKGNVFCTEYKVNPINYLLYYADCRPTFFEAANFYMAAHSSNKKIFTLIQESIKTIKIPTFILRNLNPINQVLAATGPIRLAMVLASLTKFERHAIDTFILKSEDCNTVLYDHKKINQPTPHWQEFISHPVLPPPSLTCQLLDDSFFFQIPYIFFSLPVIYFLIYIVKRNEKPSTL